MTTEATPGALGSNDQLGPPMEPVAWFRAPYGTLEPNPLFRLTGPQSLEWAVACFTEGQLRTAVAAERKQRETVFAALLEEQMAHAGARYALRDLVQAFEAGDSLAVAGAMAAAEALLGPNAKVSGAPATK